MIHMSVISKYSKSVQNQIKSILGASNTCTVTTEADGTIKVSTGAMVVDHDTRAKVEFFTASQVLSPAEKCWHMHKVFTTTRLTTMASGTTGN